MSEVPLVIDEPVCRVRLRLQLRFSSPTRIGVGRRRSNSNAWAKMKPRGLAQSGHNAAKLGDGSLFMARPSVVAFYLLRGLLPLPRLLGPPHDRRRFRSNLGVQISVLAELGFELGDSRDVIYRGVWHGPSNGPKSHGFQNFNPSYGELSRRAFIWRNFRTRQ